jgi:hypothetical protein
MIANLQVRLKNAGIEDRIEALSPGELRYALTPNLQGIT